jgi:predicted metalloprotease with PDZ domain
MPSARFRQFILLGDTILKIGKQNPSGNLEQQVSELKPGDIIQLRVQTTQGERDLSFPLGSREEVEFVLQDIDNISPQQRARRRAWLTGESQRPGDARP